MFYDNTCAAFRGRHLKSAPSLPAIITSFFQKPFRDYNAAQSLVRRGRHVIILTHKETSLNSKSFAAKMETELESAKPSPLISMMPADESLMQHLPVMWIHCHVGLMSCLPLCLHCWMTPEENNAPLGRGRCWNASNWMGLCVIIRLFHYAGFLSFLCLLFSLLIYFICCFLWSWFPNPSTHCYNNTSFLMCD